MYPQCAHKVRCCVHNNKAIILFSASRCWTHPCPENRYPWSGHTQLTDKKKRWVLWCKETKQDSLRLVWENDSIWVRRGYCPLQYAYLFSFYLNSEQPGNLLSVLLFDGSEASEWTLRWCWTRSNVAKGVSNGKVFPSEGLFGITCLHWISISTTMGCPCKRSAEKERWDWCDVLSRGQVCHLRAVGTATAYAVFAVWISTGFLSLELPSQCFPMKSQLTRKKQGQGPCLSLVLVGSQHLYQRVKVMQLFSAQGLGDNPPEAFQQAAISRSPGLPFESSNDKIYEPYAPSPSLICSLRRVVDNLVILGMKPCPLEKARSREEQLSCTQMWRGDPRVGRGVSTVTPTFGLSKPTSM